MASRRRTQEGPKGDINVTPLVDVVLVMLVIFMVITPMLQRGANVELPVAKNPEKSKEIKEQVTISVDKEGVIWWETDQIDAATLAAKLDELRRTRPTTPIFIKGDVMTNYGQIRRVMKIINEAEFMSVGVITKEEEKSAA